MDPIKISTHRARITEALQNCGYVREFDQKIIICEGGTLMIDGRKSMLETIDDEVRVFGYTLTGLTDQVLTWSKKGEEDVVWRKGDIKNLKKMVDYIRKTSKGVEPQWGIKEDDEFISCHRSEVETPLAVSVRDVNDMVIPTLKELDFLATHFEQAEALAKDLGIITDGKVRPNLKVAFTMRMLESLKEVPGAHSAMQQLMITNEYDFFRIRTILLKTFCNRARLKSVIKERMGMLKFTGCNRAEKFLSESSAVLSIITRLYDKEWVLEYSNCVVEIVAKLPSFMRMRVHSKLREISNEGRWELAVPFDEACSTQPIFDACISPLTIADLIRKHSESQLELDDLNNRTTWNTPKTDKVNRIHDETADEFAARFKTTKVVFPKKGVSTDQANRRLTDIGFETRVQLSRNQSTYFLAGTDVDAQEAEQHLNKWKELFSYREFVFKNLNQKN